MESAAAVKAKETALEKMRIFDFSGARQSVFEAQMLYPAMEGLDQMLLICNVHCSAAEGGGADGRDWYKILDVSASTDEAAVRSRCGRMALGLHPDRNKFPGAAEAFQMIVEAKAVLGDSEKRRVYDGMCRAKATAEQWGFGGFSRYRNHDESHGFSRFRDFNESNTIKLNHSSGVLSEGETGISDFGFSSFLNVVHNQEGHNSENGLLPENGSNGIRSLWPKLNEPSSMKQNLDATTKFSDGAQNQPSKGRGRGRPKESKVDEAIGGKQNAVPNLENGSLTQPKRPRGRPRGSGGRGRGRGRGSSKVGHDQGEIACPTLKKSKNVGSCSEAKQDDQEGKRDNAPATVIRPDSEILEYRDAEFNDFEQERSRELFQAGQIWAVYDTLDAMPRFYAMINVVADDHKLEITWLEPLPNDDDEKEWLYRGLPASFGKFKHGYTDMIQDYAVFSHLVNWKRDAILRKVYEIRPQKGETWAVFKNWDIKWERMGGFEYEVVEILSDYYSEFGVNVGVLGKIDGFCCVYGRKVGTGVDWEVIKGKDRLRFSHRIPSFAVSVDGPDGVGSFFELDPASLPSCQ